MLCGRKESFYRTFRRQNVAPELRMFAGGICVESICVPVEGKILLGRTYLCPPRLAHFRQCTYVQFLDVRAMVALSWVFLLCNYIL